MVSCVRCAEEATTTRTAFMKAFVFERTGDPDDVLAVRELPKPKPRQGEILVRVRLSPVHPSDMHIMRGRFGRQPTLPASPGIECVGVVEALGAGVAGPAPGTRVVLLNVWGSWRELTGHCGCPARSGWGTSRRQAIA